MKLILYVIERFIFNLKIRWYDFRAEECSKKASRLNRKHRKTKERYDEFLKYYKKQTWKFEEVMNQTK